MYINISYINFPYKYCYSFIFFGAAAQRGLRPPYSCCF